MKLKLSVIIVISFLLNPCLSFAQVGVNFGVKAGGNLSLFLGEDAGEANFLAGPHVGGLAQFTFGGNDEDGFIKYAVQAEAFYSMQGAKDGSDKTTLSYLNIPVMAQRYFGSSGFYVETGPQIGFLLSAKSKDADGTVDIKSQLKSIDIAFILGLGYKFSSGIGINARFSNGLTSISSGDNIKNETIGFGLFYIFGKKSGD